MQGQTRHGHGLGSSMDWVGLGPKFSPMKWVGLPEINNFFTTIIILLRKSLNVIHHYSLHHEFFPQLPLGVAFYLIVGF